MEWKVIRTAGPDPRCNCHGWVFAGGRYWLHGAFVESILHDNGYEPAGHTRPGDVAIFRNSAGEMMHSGLVRSVGDDGLVLVESKWGQLGRYIHIADEHMYRGLHATYYHTARGGHQLQGVQAHTPAGNGG
jgi:hypothetical protein